MTACAFCLHHYISTVCVFPGSQWCDHERRMEDLAHAINDSYNRAQVRP